MYIHLAGIYFPSMGIIKSKYVSVCVLLFHFLSACFWNFSCACCLLACGCTGLLATTLRNPCNNTLHPLQQHSTVLALTPHILCNDFLQQHYASPATTLPLPCNSTPHLLQQRSTSLATTPCKNSTPLYKNPLPFLQDLPLSLATTLHIPCNNTLQQYTTLLATTLYILCSNTPYLLQQRTQSLATTLCNNTPPILHQSFPRRLQQRSTSLATPLCNKTQHRLQQLSTFLATTPPTLATPLPPSCATKLRTSCNKTLQQLLHLPCNNCPHSLQQHSTSANASTRDGECCCCRELLQRAVAESCCRELLQGTWRLVARAAECCCNNTPH